MPYSLELLRIRKQQLNSLFQLLEKEQRVGRLLSPARSIQCNLVIQKIEELLDQGEVYALSNHLDRVVETPLNWLERMWTWS